MSSRYRFPRAVRGGVTGLTAGLTAVAMLAVLAPVAPAAGVQPPPAAGTSQSPFDPGQPVDGTRVFEVQLDKGVSKVFLRRDGIAVTADRWFPGLLLERADEATTRRFVERVDKLLDGLAANPEGNGLLAFLGQSRPLAAASGDATAGGVYKNAAGEILPINVILHRGLPDDEGQWPRELREKLDALAGQPADQQVIRDSYRSDLMAIPQDVEAAQNGSGSVGHVQFSDDPVLSFEFNPDGTRLASDEGLILGHELKHVSDYVAGELDRTLVPLEVRYQKPDKSWTTGRVRTSAAELYAVGAERPLAQYADQLRKQDSTLVANLGKGKAGNGAIDVAIKRLLHEQDALANDTADENTVKQRRAEIQNRLRRTTDLKVQRTEVREVTENTIRRAAGLPTRDAYNLPDGFYYDNPDAPESDRKPYPGRDPKRDSGYVKVRETTAFGERIKDPERLWRELNPKPGLFARCKVLFGKGSPAQCLGDAEGPAPSKETVDRITANQQTLAGEGENAHISVLYQENSGDQVVVRQQAEKFRAKSLRSVAPECAGGKTNCMALDWEHIQQDLRSEAEHLAETKVAALGTDAEASLTTSLDESLRKADAFFVPYEKTRATLAEEIKLAKAGSRVGVALGGGLWIAGMAEAFTQDTSALDKATAITAPVPVLGNLMGIVDSINHGNIPDTTVNVGVLLAELAEIAGISEEAGPIGLFIGGLYAVLRMGPSSQDEVKVYDGIVAGRNEVWANSLREQLKGDWASKASARYAELYFSLLKGQALQSATVRALTAYAEARATTAKGTRPVPDARHVTAVISELERNNQRFAALGGAADLMFRQTAGKFRMAVEDKLARSMSDAWSSPEAKQFNDKFVAMAKELRSKYRCPDNANSHGGAACFGYEQEQDRLLDDALHKLGQPPAGLGTREIGQVLSEHGWPSPDYTQLLPAGQKELPAPKLASQCSVWHPNSAEITWDISVPVPEGTVVVARERLWKEQKQGPEYTYKASDGKSPGWSIPSSGGENKRIIEVFYRFPADRFGAVESKQIGVAVFEVGFARCDSSTTTEERKP